MQRASMAFHVKRALDVNPVMPVLMMSLRGLSEQQSAHASENQPGVPERMESARMG